MSGSHRVEDNKVAYTHDGLGFSADIQQSFFDSRWAPGVFYKYFYNHVHRLRLEKLLYIELSRSSSGYFEPLPDPVDRFASETAARRFQKLNGRYVLCNRFGSETVKKFITIICNGHSPTDKCFRSGVTVM
jgi:hypothetical protein